MRGAPKDLRKPKGPMSAYACFVQVIREEHKKKHPDEQVIFSEFSKKCAEKWKQMTPNEKKRFEDMSQMDKDRYNREMDDYVPMDGSKKGRKRKRTKDPMMPKRAWSAFFFFCDEFRPEVRAKHPEWRVGEVAKDLGQKWEKMTDKSKYESLAIRDKQRYEEDMGLYRAGTFVPGKRRITSLGEVPVATVVPPEEDDDEEEELDE